MWELDIEVLEFIKLHQAGRFQTILIRGNDFEKNNIYNNNTLYAKLGGKSSFCKSRVLA
jgi:hypothetical protein